MAFLSSSLPWYRLRPRLPVFVPLLGRTLPLWHVCVRHVVLAVLGWFHPVPLPIRLRVWHWRLLVAVPLWQRP